MPVTKAASNGRAAFEGVICGAQVVTPGGVLPEAAVRIQDGHIASVEEFGRQSSVGQFNARGCILMPGLIDLHSDAIERSILPRPGARYGTDLVLREMDKQLAACGITRMYHSLMVGGIDPHELRQAGPAASVARDIFRLNESLMIHHRVHMRCEITAVESLQMAETLLSEGIPDICSLMDHSVGQGQFTEIDSLKEFYRAESLNDMEIEAMVAAQLLAKANMDDHQIEVVAHRCVVQGLALFSHDDDSPEKIEQMARLGVTVSEFPVNLQAAKAACSHGMSVLLGAPNLVRGRSSCGNLNGRSCVSAGFCRIIGSDYSPTALIHAVWTVAREGLAPLHEAVNMATQNPAQVMGIGHQTGSIEVGKAADLVLVEMRGEIPDVLWTMVGGKTAYARF